jgi:4-carboxymuconolactone decarboxylase
MTRPRIAPLDAPFEPAVDEVLRKLMGGRTEVAPLALFRTMVHHIDFADRIRPLGGRILSGGTLGPRERELVIHRVCARTRCEYEWGVHAVMFARPLGLSQEWIDATVTATADDSIWTHRESLIVRLVDELHDTSRISDELWRELAVEWRTDQLIELMMVAGWYHLISYVANGPRVQIEEWAPRFPVVGYPGLDRLRTEG